MMTLHSPPSWLRLVVLLLLGSSGLTIAKEFQWFPQGDAISFSDPGNWYDLSPDADPRNPSGPPGGEDTAHLSSGAEVNASGIAVAKLTGLGTSTLILQGPFSAQILDGGGMNLRGSGDFTAQNVLSLVTIVGGHLTTDSYSARALSVESDGSLTIKSGVQPAAVGESFLFNVDTEARLDILGLATDVDGSIRGGARTAVEGLLNLNTRQATLSVSGAGSSLSISGSAQVRSGSLDVSGGATVSVGDALTFEGASSDGLSTTASSSWHGSETQITVEGGLNIGARAGSYTIGLGQGARITSAGGMVIGYDSGAEGHLGLADSARVELALSPIIVGHQGQGMIQMDTGSELVADKLILGRSSLDNLVSAGQDTILGVRDELVVGDGGRGRLELESGCQAVVKRLVVGRGSQADNRVTIRGTGTMLSGAGRVDVGEQGGRGSLEIRTSAEVRPSGGLSVGIYDGSIGSLEIHDAGELSTSGTAILGGGLFSQATASMQSGGKFSAADVLIFAKPTGVSTVHLTGDPLSPLPTILVAANQLEIGFSREAGGPASLTLSHGAYASAGVALYIGNNGLLDASDGRVTVGTLGFPDSGTVRVGAGGILRGSGRVVGNIEALDGAVIAPGASPGTLTVQGDYRQEPGARMEIEIGGTVAGIDYDSLQVDGEATIAGGTLAIAFVNGFSPREGQIFELLKVAGSFNGSFTSAEISGVAPGFAYTLASDGANGLSLRADNDGTGISAPLLEFAHAGSVIQLSWPAPGDWVLEMSAGLPTSWSPAEWVPSRDDDRFVVTIPANLPAAFFRLRP